MSSKITCFAILSLTLWFGDFHALHVTAFFDYNKFHPLPFRPDLQEHCPQVSRRTATTCFRKKIFIVLNILIRASEMNWWKKMHAKFHIYFKLNESDWERIEDIFRIHFSLYWTLPFCLILFLSVGESDAKFRYKWNDGILVCCSILCIVWGGRRIFLHEM